LHQFYKKQTKLIEISKNRIGLRAMGHHHHQHCTDIKQHHHLRANETRTIAAVFLSLGAMALELYYGYAIGSNALIMDGWHMLTHVLILLLAWGTYKLIDFNVFKHTSEHRVLSISGFVSAFTLLFFTLFMLVESFEKLNRPELVVTDAAFVTIILGLIVNGICAFLLHQGHESDEHDYNIYAAYIHVLADVLMSFIALIALLAARYYAIYWLDAVSGILASLVILKWASSLLRNSWLEIKNS
jgi:cation diffusion facilitator family transporter